MALEKVKDELYRCISCSECYGRGPNLPFRDAALSIPYWICPILEKFKFLSYSPQAMMFMANKVFYKNFPITDEMVKIFYSCVSCAQCEQQCTRPFMDIFRAMKEEMAQRGFGPPAPVREANENIRTKHNFFGARNEGRLPWTKGFNLSREGDVLYFAGCYASFRQPEIAAATVKVLQAAGYKVAYLGEDEWCCGMSAGWSGQPDIEAEMARHNVELVSQTGAKVVAFSCAEGFRTFTREYPRILGRLPFQVVHVSQLLASLLQRGRLKFTQPVNGNIAYHDPCFLGRHSRVYEEPRQVLASIPGLTLTELGHNRVFADCCGSGAGVTGLAFPELERIDSRKRLLQAKEAGASALVTACPRCVEALRRTARAEAINLNVGDITLMASQALGL